MLIFIHIKRYSIPFMHLEGAVDNSDNARCSVPTVTFISSPTQLWKLPQLDWPFWPWNAPSQHQQIMELSRLEKIFKMMEARHYPSMHRSVRFDGFYQHWCLGIWLKPRLLSKQSKGILSWRLAQSQWYPVQNKTRQSTRPQPLGNCWFDHSWQAIACWRENRPFQCTKVQSLLPCLSCASPSWPERACAVIKTLFSPQALPI